MGINIKNKMPDWFYVITTVCRNKVMEEKKQSPFMTGKEVGILFSELLWEQINKPEFLINLMNVKDVYGVSKRFLEYIEVEITSMDCTCGADTGNGGSVDICFEHQFIVEMNRIVNKFEGQKNAN